MWRKSSKAGLGIYSGPMDFNPLSHTGKIYQLVEDLPVCGEDQSDSDRAEGSEKELEEEVTDSVEGDGVHSKQF